MNEATDIKCRCQHCSGKIAFDASGWKPGERRMVKCPHCGLDTVLFDPATVGSDELGRTGGVVVQITGGVSPLGVASVCLGLVACLGCWVPVLGLVAIPMAGIGLLLAAIGFIVDRKSNRSFLVAGVIVCIVAVVTTLVVSELTALGVRHEMQRIAREKQVREAAAAQAREEAHQRWIE